MNPTSNVQSTASPSLWFVRSDTDHTHYYTVSTDARGLLRCECKSAQYRRTPCKHQRAVAAGLVRPAHPKSAAVKAPVLSSKVQALALSEVDSLYSDAGEGIRRSLAVQKVHSSALAAVAS